MIRVGIAAAVIASAAAIVPAAASGVNETPSTASGGGAGRDGTWTHVSVKQGPASSRGPWVCLTIEPRPPHLTVDGCAIGKTDYRFDPITWTASLRGQITVPTYVRHRRDGSDRTRAGTVSVRLAIAWRSDGLPRPAAHVCPPYCRSFAHVERGAIVTGTVSIPARDVRISLRDLPGRITIP